MSDVVQYRQEAVLAKTQLWGREAGGYDLIIPVYNACEETRTCIESVLKHTLSEELLHRMVIIDDKSTEPVLLGYLRGLVARNLPKVLVLRNRSNLGYVRTVNSGISLSGRDVVLLNSDTVVTKGWLSKLHQCACSRPNVATVTPLTNNGTICSVPEFCELNSLPDGYTVDSFGTLVEQVAQQNGHVAQRQEQVAQHNYPRIPTAVGFCMLIKRKVLAEVGLLDEETYGRGYGEENEFCCRAEQRGYVHLLDDATYIYHHGSCSFQAEKQELVTKNSLLLAEQYPEYFWRVRQFVEANPLREIQENIKRAIQK